jgi:hypothetical protein
MDRSERIFSKTAHGVDVLEEGCEDLKISHGE